MNNLRLLKLCTLFAITIVFLGGVLEPRDANAQRFKSQFAGTYLLIDDDEPSNPFPSRQRLVTLSRDGNFFSTVQKLNFRDFDDDRGTWQQTGANEITALTIAFGYDSATGEVTGAFRDVYILTFGNIENGKFQIVTGGSVSGEGFALGQNPLNPTDPPESMFSLDITQGQRVK